MKHITLNTGNSEEVIQPPLFSLDRVIEGVLPEPCDRYSIAALFAEEGWIYFDLELDGEHITVNMVGLGGSEAWEQIISLYLMIYQSAPPVPASSPDTPWLATVVLPTSKIFESQMMAQIEQAIALCLTK